MSGRRQQPPPLAPRDRAALAEVLFALADGVANGSPATPGPEASVNDADLETAVEFGAAWLECERVSDGPFAGASLVRWPERQAEARRRAIGLALEFAESIGESFLTQRRGADVVELREADR